MKNRTPRRGNRGKGEGKSIKIRALGGTSGEKKTKKKKKCKGEIRSKEGPCVPGSILGGGRGSGGGLKDPKAFRWGLQSQVQR